VQQQLGNVDLWSGKRYLISWEGGARGERESPKKLEGKKKQVHCKRGSASEGQATVREGEVSEAFEKTKT